MANPQSMPAVLTIRHASVADAPALGAFAAKSFSDTYRGLDDPQEIADYVAEHFTAGVVAQVIRDPACITLLAELNGRLAGYAVIKSGAAPACVAGSSAIELARFYLGDEFIGHGFGAQLMLAVHREARHHAARTLWLSVYDRNLRAVRFYERLGFVKVGGKEFPFGGRMYIDPVYAAPVRDGEPPDEKRNERVA